MTGLVFVDANVLLYARDQREPVKLPRARAWLEHLWDEAIGRTSIQVLSEYYVNLGRKGFSDLTPEEAWKQVAKYLVWRPRSIDEEVFLCAREIEHRYRISWWDSLAVAAAQLQDCTVLLTEDLQDGMTIGALRIRNPFLHAVGEPEAPYAVIRPSAPIHRARGRPRRADGARS
jgi:predicted nucleic acid-binding protein